ncbi:MAG TPA: hypothetical protein VHM91_21390 [Verrucomicrobiales bacterium]|nr:hypothetical protein [Verrucomicrobiales bacterium]
MDIPISPATSLLRIRAVTVAAIENLSLQRGDRLLDVPGCMKQS